MDRRWEKGGDFGFDPQVARKNLMMQLIESGSVSQEQLAEWRAHAADRTPLDVEEKRKHLVDVGTEPDLIDDMTEHWLIENARREALTDEDIEWKVAQSAAYFHALLHGMPAKIDGMPAPRCEQWPCRAGGAAFALLELCQVVADRADTAKLIADDLAFLAQHMRKAKSVRDRLSQALVTKEERRARLGKRLRLAPSPWSDCLTYVRMHEQLEHLLDSGSVQVRHLLSSAELRRAKPGSRGRPKQWTLIALSQHLEKGGFSQREIANMIPDDNPERSDDARIDRVHNRLAEPECRGLVPHEPETVAASPTEQQ